MRRIFAVFIVVFMIAAAAAFYYNDALRHAAGTALKSFQKTNLGVLLDEIKRDILAPTPLNIGGKDGKDLAAQKIIEQTNIARYDNGFLPALKENAKLDAVAQAKANDMFVKQYFEHVSPEGVNPGTLVKSYGYNYVVTGENLILGNFSSEKEAVDDWMNSPGHRANILNNRFSEIGVAVVKGTYKGDTVWIGVQEFGLPLSACPQPETGLKSQIEGNKQSLDTLETVIDSKREQIDATNPRSSQYSELVDQYNALVSQYNPLNDETKSLITRYNAEVNTFNLCVTGR